MSGRKSYAAWGEGVAIDTVNGLYFPAIEEVRFNFGMELMEIEDADSMSNEFVTVKQPLTGHVMFGKNNSDIWTMLTGGGATAGGKTRVRDEKHTASGGTFSLSATPTTYTEYITKVGGPVFKRVSSGASGAEYTISGTLITIGGASYATASFVCDYLKDTISGQITIEVEDNDAPTNFGIISTFRSVDKEAASESLSDIVIVCPKVRRSSEIAWGSGPRSQAKIEFDFVIEKSAGNPLYSFIFPSA